MIDIENRSSSGLQPVNTRPAEVTRPRQSFVISPTESGAREVPHCDTKKARARLIGCSAKDLTFLDYGVGSRMWMSRKAQISDNALPNKSASHGIQLHKINVLIRGTVLIEHQERVLSAPRRSA